MGLVKLAKDVVHATSRIMAGNLEREARLRLVRTYMGFRCREVLSRRFGVANNHADILGCRIRFLDSSWFHTSFNEVFVDGEYFFHADTARPCIVDCGSNIGLTVLYFKHLYPGAEVLAIEPQPDVFAVLKENVESNHLTGVSLVNSAVGKCASTAKLYSDATNPGDLRATISPEIADTRGQPLKEVMVSSQRLSQLLPARVDLLKMDIEGAELEVLEDLAPCFSRVAQLFVELHLRPTTSALQLAQIMKLLETGGFSCLVRGGLQLPLATSACQHFNLLVHARR